jgi:CubicO group peptidase (beta-lactamase class C family)
VTAAGSAAARGVLPDRSVGHTGFTGTSIWLDPEEESIRILLTNRVHPEVDEALDFQAVRSRFHALSLGAGSAAHW